MSQTVEKLISWATDRGAYLHDLVEVYDDPVYGISLRVQRDKSEDPSRIESTLLAQSRLVSCPFDLSLSYLNAVDVLPTFRARSDRVPRSFLQSAGPNVIANFFLVQQYLKGDSSFWGPYITSLPQPHEHQKLGTPLYFTDEDLKWIRGTSLEVARNQRQQIWRSEWETGLSVLLKSDGNFVREKELWTWDLYRWAATIFSSRSFVSKLIPKEILELPQMHKNSDDASLRLLEANPAADLPDKLDNHPFPVLFPLVDLANHSSTARVTWFSNAHNEPKDLSIIINSDIAEGNQIFNNYAPKGNTELLLGYGFCLPENDEVTIEFTSLKDRHATVRKLQLSCQTQPATVAEQRIFAVRRKPYDRPTDDGRLPEFAVFEDGLVDTVSLLVANQNEFDFMSRHPTYRSETNSVASFAGVMARNTLHTISILYEKLQTSLSRILLLGKDLGEPSNLNQRTAKIYREGQIQTLRAAVEPLKKRLDIALLSQDNINLLQSVTTDVYETMLANVKLLTVPQAFEWLLDTEPRLWSQVIDAISIELEVEKSPVMDWQELIENEWDFALWCLWLYLVASSHFLSTSAGDQSSNFIRDCIKQTYVTYNSSSSPNFNSAPCSFFHGDKDEEETLWAIINRLDVLNVAKLDTNMEEEEGGLRRTKVRLLNLVSWIVMEECIPFGGRMADDEVEMKGVVGLESWRVGQKVLCLVRRREGEMIEMK